MSHKVLLRCSLISALFAVPAPLLIGFAVMLSGGELAMVMRQALEFEGMARAYVAGALMAFVLFEIATVVVYALLPKPTVNAESVSLDNDDREVGVVKWFNVNKGYGFITRDGGEDVFVHFRAIRGKGHRTLAEGQRVRYYAVENERGLQAEDVTVIT